MSQSADSLRAGTDSVDSTRRLAAAIADLARPGDLILLIGDLGAGKTAFAQGFASGLGVSDKVTSPTFALVQSYEGRIGLNHLDVYRLGHMSETADLGLSELLDDDAVTLIEWGDMILSALPREYLQVQILADETEDDCRDVTIVPRGAIWRPRMNALALALQQWLVTEESDVESEPGGSSC